MLLGCPGRISNAMLQVFGNCLQCPTHGTPRTVFAPILQTRDKQLPLDLTENNVPDVALVVELTESGAYLGQTILTMRMAYTNARLVSRPDSDWLSTEICANVDLSGDEE